MHTRHTFSAARAVHAESLTPTQHTTSRSFRTAADVRLQCMVKHPHLSEFHSLAEHLHAGLLEGTPSVSCYVPQPFRLRIGKRRYTPDCYVVEGHKRRMIELKPRGEFDDALKAPLEAFFAMQGMVFEVVANESVYERSLEAQNWLAVTRVLHLNRELNTHAQELEVLEAIAPSQGRALGEIIDPGHRRESLGLELARAIDAIARAGRHAELAADRVRTHPPSLTPGVSTMLSVSSLEIVLADTDDDFSTLCGISN